MTAPSWRRWPRIVAESLASVAEPIETIGLRPRQVTAAGALDAASAAQAPSRAPGEPPAFLQPQQIDAWRRAHHTLAHWGGALLAEPTGTGKTWIALAIAAAERRCPLVVAPAVLLPQWVETARQADVPIRLWSQERLSRGALPPHSPQLVIVDEAHRFRDSGTRRAQTLAPWLLGRRVLLLSATPIVNHIRDLITLLRLMVAEDALALDGIPALGDLERCSLPPSALRRLIIRTPGQEHLVGRRGSAINVSGADNQRAEVAVRVIDSLALSRDQGVRRLLRTVLLDAAASSDAALHRALARYRSLLLHSRDAGGMSRASIRQFAGEALDQLVFWEMIGGDGDSELVTSDIPRAIAALEVPQSDGGWIRALLAQLGETRPAVCFTRHRATATALRTHIGDAAAWVIGSEAGIGPHRLPRSVVLAAFGPRREEWVARRSVPRILVATDVAAEGLDLQAAGCIAHIDLPWTAMRLAQREGRLLRIGQLHDEVRIVIRHPAPRFEEQLAPRARIQRKQTLSERWLLGMAQHDQDSLAAGTEPQVALLRSADTAASLVVIALTRGGRTGIQMLAREEGGPWSSSDSVVENLSTRAHAATPASGDEQTADASATLASALRYALRACEPGALHAVALVTRIQRLARAAAARRDAPALISLDRLLRFATTPTSLGGRLRLDRLRDSSDAEILKAEVVDCPRPQPVAAQVVAALLFRSPAVTLRSPDARYPDRPLRS